ncbi:hypothetical protein [Rhizobium leguminosarum]|uniref:hypothetical protein n=1 Tax=Rhizobium leguminosarum TaxID=384 RepID=UPI0013EF2994|nr:hypothetical protein [Rhizobium leguminosarum]
MSFESNDGVLADAVAVPVDFSSIEHLQEVAEILTITRRFLTLMAGGEQACAIL